MLSVFVRLFTLPSHTVHHCATGYRGIYVYTFSSKPTTLTTLFNAWKEKTQHEWKWKVNRCESGILLLLSFLIVYFSPGWCSVQLAILTILLTISCRSRPGERQDVSFMFRQATKSIWLHIFVQELSHKGALLVTWQLCKPDESDVLITLEAIPFNTGPIKLLNEVFYPVVSCFLRAIKSSLIFTGRKKNWIPRGSSNVQTHLRFYFK